MVYLPKWMQDVLEKACCPFCKATLTKSGVFGLGMREEKKKMTFCYEYKCSKCKNCSIFTGFPTSWHEFISDIIEIAQKADESGDAPVDEMKDLMTSKESPIKKKISKEEVTDALKTLNESEDLRDYFTKIGIEMNLPESTTDESK